MSFSGLEYASSTLVHKCLNNSTPYTSLFGRQDHASISYPQQIP